MNAGIRRRAFAPALGAPVVRYGAALLLVLGATLLSTPTRPFLGRSLFAWYYVAVIAAALFGGMGPALLAIAGTMIAGVYWLQLQYGHLPFSEPVELLNLIVPLIVCLLVAALASAARASGLEAERRARESAALADELEEARRELEARSGALIAEAASLAHLGSWEWDITTNRVSWSPQLYEIFGMTAGTPVDYASYVERLHPDDREHAEAVIRAAQRSQQSFALEHRIVRPDGQVRWVSARGRVIPGSSGAPARLLGVTQDVTEQREAADAARRLGEEEAARRAAQASEQRLAFLARASETLASSLDFETTLRSVARMCVPAIADWAAVDLVGADGTLRRLAVEHEDPAKVDFVARLAERYPDREDADFGVHHVLRTQRAEMMAEIPPGLLDGAARDDEHRRLLHELGLRSYMIAPLAARGERLGAITVVYAESQRNYRPEDLGLLEDVARRAAVAIENARLVREVMETRDQLEQQAGELESQAEELREAHEEMEVANEELRHTADELLQRTTQLEQARDEAEAANRAKSEFLAMMSHELRTPLNAIGGYAQLMEMGLRGPLTAAQHEDLARIRRSQEHLLGLINDVLNFAKLEAGRVNVEIEDVRVRQAFQLVHELIAPQAQARDLRLVLAPCSDDIAVRADAEKLQQVLLNLLSNAVKFTEPGGEIVLGCTGEGDRVHLRVRDTGVGIPPDKLEAVFEPFVQVGRARMGPGQGGTGLGLSISRDLARHMGGDLTLESRVGDGSSFTVTLPRA